jgi:hypothetical protein
MATENGLVAGTAQIFAAAKPNWISDLSIIVEGT